MSIFNETFTDDKPIYYPSTWGTGKTAPELYEEWKLTSEYFILSNIVQCFIAGAWVCFVFVICTAIQQMWRLYRLDQNKRQRIENRKFISKNFIMSTSFIALIVFGVTITLLFLSQFTRLALIKGLFFCIFVYCARAAYKKGKIIYLQRKQRNKDYERIKKQEQQQ